MIDLGLTLRSFDCAGRQGFGKSRRKARLERVNEQEHYFRNIVNRAGKATVTGNTTCCLLASTLGAKTTRV